jgi:hypothetical protein
MLISRTPLLMHEPEMPADRRTGRARPAIRELTDLVLSYFRALRPGNS